MDRGRYIGGLSLGNSQRKAGFGQGWTVFAIDGQDKATEDPDLGFQPGAVLQNEDNLKQGEGNATRKHFYGGNAL